MLSAVSLILVVVPPACLAFASEFIALHSRQYRYWKPKPYQHDLSHVRYGCQEEYLTEDGAHIAPWLSFLSMRDVMIEYAREVPWQVSRPSVPPRPLRKHGTAGTRQPFSRES